MERTSGTSGAHMNVTSVEPTSGTSGALTDGTTEPPTDAPADKGMLGIVKNKVMESAFALLKGKGKNSIEGLLDYLKERNVLDGCTETIVKQALEGVSDPTNIDFGKFAEVCGSVLKEKGYDLEHLTKSAAKSLFGGGSAAGSSSVAVVGDTSTSAKPTAVDHLDEVDDHRAASENHFEVSDDHNESSEIHNESGDDPHKSDVEHHESDVEHHESDVEHHESNVEHHESDEEHHESDDDHQPKDHHDSTKL